MALPMRRRPQRQWQVLGASGVRPVPIHLGAVIGEIGLLVISVLCVVATVPVGVVALNAAVGAAAGNAPLLMPVALRPWGLPISEVLKGSMVRGRLLGRLRGTAPSVAAGVAAAAATPTLGLRSLAIAAAAGAGRLVETAGRRRPLALAALLARRGALRHVTAASRGRLVGGGALIAIGRIGLGFELGLQRLALETRGVRHLAALDADRPHPAHVLQHLVDLRLCGV
mmetsp:Transcript_103075/g.298119  ORF Transcript_103075/g.298119 Transcript_103075/m.298119 type:complete len:227 (+) Transcript_103075:1107-1787(+)